MKINTYYVEVPGISSFDSLKLLAAWKERWRAIGFEPFVLNEHIARKHPFFAEFDAAIAKLPTQNSPAYEAACFHRWLALAQVGGGLLSDYDTFPVNQPSQAFSDSLGSQVETLQILQSNCCCPCLAYASRSVCERLCLEFSTREWQPHIINGHVHISDQYCIELLVTQKADWIAQRDIVRMIGDEGWEKMTAVHLANRAMMALGKTPRWKYVDELIP